MRDFALVVISFDGIASMYSGVGVVVNFFFEGYDEIRTRAGLDHVDLYAAASFIKKDSPDFNHDIYRAVSEKCAQHGGNVALIPSFVNGAKLLEVWRGNDHVNYLTQWESCSLSMASFIKGLSAAGYKKIFVLAHDTIFAKTAAHLQSEDVRLCWIPHSLSHLFVDHYHEGRLSFETESIRNLVQQNNYIGFISDQTKELLISNYGVRHKSLISFYSGIYYRSAKYKGKNEISIANRLKEAGIPTHKKLIFSWGRCVRQKGFDLIIDSFSQLLNDPSVSGSDYHLVLLAPTYMTPLPYHELIVKKLERIKPSVSFIESFHSSLAYDVVKYTNTRIVLLASRFEGFGLTSLEVNAFRHAGLGIVYSDIPTFEEVFTGCPYALRAENNNHQSLYEKMRQLVSNGPTKEVSIVNPKYDFITNYAHGLKKFLNLAQR